MTRLYYTAPPDECFDDMKQAAQQIWSGYGDPYKSEKLERIEHVSNVRDNFMYLLGMFDQQNQRKIGLIINDKTKAEVRVRLLDGGLTEFELPF